MVSVTVKLFAVACVLCLLLTGMQVMTQSVAATESDATLVTNPSAKKRLTMSETSARDPMVASSGSIAHLAWIDSSASGEAVLWKRTSGDGAYTSPEALSQRFESIVDLDISADVQSRVPYNIQSSVIGDPYDFLTVGEVLEFIFDCLVWIGTSLYNLAEMVYEAGVMFIANLTASAIQAIQTAVDKIVDAFQAFVDWLVDFVRDTILDPLTSIIEDIWDGVVDWAAGLGAIISRLAAEVGAGNLSVASASVILIGMIVDSAAFAAITAIGLAIYAAMLILQPVVAPFIFVLGTVVPMVFTAILKTTSQVMGEAIDAAGSALSDSAEKMVESILGSQMTSDLSIILGIVFGGMSALMEFISLAVGGSFWAFALSIFGATLSIIALTQATSSTGVIDWGYLAVIGMVSSGGSIIFDNIHASVEEALCPSWDACSGIISWASFGVSIVGLEATAYAYGQRD